MRTTTNTLLLISPFLAAALPAEYGYGGYGYGGGENEVFVGDWSAFTYAGGQGVNVTPDFSFTSYYQIDATPEQVVNATGAATGGLPGSYSTWHLGINGPQNIICWYVESYGFAGAYQSPALTATHVHEGPRGATGPPRLAFPNPEEMDGGNGVRVSRGCFTASTASTPAPALQSSASRTTPLHFTSTSTRAWRCRALTEARSNRGSEVGKLVYGGGTIIII